jgi:hypothetical protein
MSQPPPLLETVITPRRSARTGLDKALPFIIVLLAAPFSSLLAAIIAFLYFSREVYRRNEDFFVAVPSSLRSRVIQETLKLWCPLALALLPGFLLVFGLHSAEKFLLQRLNDFAFRAETQIVRQEATWVQKLVFGSDTVDSIRESAVEVPRFVRSVLSVLEVLLSLTIKLSAWYFVLVMARALLNVAARVVVKNGAATLYRLND